MACTIIIESYQVGVFFFFFFYLYCGKVWLRGCGGDSNYGSCCIICNSLFPLLLSLFYFFLNSVLFFFSGVAHVYEIILFFLSFSVGAYVSSLSSTHESREKEGEGEGGGGRGGLKWHRLSYHACFLFLQDKDSASLHSGNLYTQAARQAAAWTCNDSGRRRSEEGRGAKGKERKASPKSTRPARCFPVSSDSALPT